MAQRSNEDKINMIYCYGQANKNLHEAVRLFNDLVPGRPVDRKYLRELVAKFETTLSLKNAPRTGRPKSLNEEQAVLVLADVIENPQQSIRTLAQKHEVAATAVFREFKKNKFHPYKIKLVHELNEDDPDRRMQFCETVQLQVREEPEFLKNICFSDECSFFLNGAVNRHNFRYWAPENPHECRTSHTQHPQKINVWAGILNDQIIGPFFIEGNLDGPTYLRLLQDSVVPRINELVEANEELYPVFQQDGAPPHFALAVRQYLDRTFPERWIGRRGFIEWPARSPDMNPLDFFLWGHLKTVVYKTPPANLDVLRARIVEEIRQITPETLTNVRNAFEDRLYHCQAAMGAQFEHLIN